MFSCKEAASQYYKRGLVALVVWKDSDKNYSITNNCGRRSEIVVLHWILCALKNTEEKYGFQYDTLSQCMTHKNT